MMHKRLWASALCLLLIGQQILPAFADTLGPAETIDDLRAMLEEAQDGDTLLLSGDIAMDASAPLTSGSSVRFSSQEGETAVLRGIRLRDMSAAFSNIRFLDSLTVSGTSTVHLDRNVRVHGRSGQSALSFSGNGTLIIDPGCVIEGGDNGSGFIGGDGIQLVSASDTVSVGVSASV